MKNSVKIFTLLIGTLLFLGACKEEGLLVYENENNVYFQHKKWQSSAFGASLKYNDATLSVTTTVGSSALDSLSISMAFVNPEITSVVTFLPVILMGNVADHDRQFGWKVINTDNPDAGKEGVDFRVLDAFIPAKSRTGGIVIEMFRQNLGGEKFFYADFELVPNKNFQTNYEENTRSSSNDEIVSTLTMRLKFTDGLQQPQYWDAYLRAYLGDWSTKKAFILNENIGVPFEYMFSVPNDVTSAGYGFAFKRWLDDYRITNGGIPMYEADGITEMKAGEKII